MTDQQIVRSIARGKTAAFEILYDRYADRGFGFAYSLLREHAAAEEILQTAFCRLLEAARSGRLKVDHHGFAPVFFRTIRNLVIDRNRKRGVGGTIDESVVAGEYTSEQQWVALHETIDELIERLPDRWRESLRLRVDGHLSYDQIAAALDCSRDQVRTWIYRARRRLHEQLKKAEHFDDRL